MKFKFKIDKKIIFTAVGAAALAAMVIGLVFGIRSMSGKKAVSSSQPAANIFEKQTFAMDTFIKQQIYYDDLGENNARQAAQAVETELFRIENMTSLYKSDSELSKINAQAGMTEIKLYSPSSELYGLIEKSLGFCKKTKGTFDISVAPLVKLWGITDSGKANHTVPSAGQIKSALDKVGYKNIILNAKKKTVRLKKPFMSLDLGGVVKGYACERIKNIYEDYGIKSAVVSLGGNVYSMGSKPDGNEFTIGLRDPFGDENAIFAKITAPGKIVSTSGAYERYFIKDSVRYHHILDPGTGYPALSDLESVSVISSDGTLADCMSTWLYIEGSEGVWREIAGQNSEYSIVAVDKDKKVYASDDIKNSVTLIHGFSWADPGESFSTADDSAGSENGESPANADLLLSGGGIR